MASSRFVDPPDELRACSEAFHAEAMKHLDAVFEEQSYSELNIRNRALRLIISRSPSDPTSCMVFFPQSRERIRLVPSGSSNQNLCRSRFPQRTQCST